jgi:SAM-dependent methyltransferase
LLRGFEEHGFGDGDGIITGRSLLLNRFSSFEDIDGDDNYVSCLGLSYENLAQFGETKAKLLDVGCGDAIFSAEAHLFGFTVQGIDLFATNDESRRQKVFNQYAKGYLFAECVKRYKGAEPKCSVGQPTLRDRCVQGRRSTETRYLSNPPTIGDCTNLKDAFQEDSQFDGAVCSFVLMYLQRAKALEALKEMARVTKPAGLIRIFEGDANPGMGLPLKLNVDGITEVSKKRGLRIFKVEK